MLLKTLRETRAPTAGLLVELHRRVERGKYRVRRGGDGMMSATELDPGAEWWDPPK